MDSEVQSPMLEEARHDTVEAGGLEQPVSWRPSARRLVELGVAASAFVALFWPTIVGLVADWSLDPDVSHGFLVPLVSAAILLANRDRFAAVTVRRSLLGLGVLLGSLVLFFLGYVTMTNVVERVALWGALIGSVWFSFGWGVLRAQPFPFGFLLLAIPPPFFILNPVRLQLKELATRLAADGLATFGLSVEALGNILVVDGHRLEVADACSGIRSLMAVITMAVLFAYLFRAGWWKGALLVLSGVPIAVLINVIRVAVMAVALSQLDVDLTEGTAHEVTGLVVFGLSIVFLYLAWRFYDWLFRWNPEGGAP